MMILLHPVLALLRLLARSVFLAIGQVWANKGRSILTTIGIVIGVAAGPAGIAPPPGRKPNAHKDVE